MKRKAPTAAFKSQVALAAYKGARTVNEVAGRNAVHPMRIRAWKKQLISRDAERPLNFQKCWCIPGLLLACFGPLLLWSTTTLASSLSVSLSAVT